MTREFVSLFAETVESARGPESVQLDVARELAGTAGPAVEYVESDLYGAIDALGSARFDLVYTGVGALCWLPDIERWAATVGGLLRPGGRLFMREGHPMLWTLDDPRPDGLAVVTYPYFETAGVRFSEAWTYVDHAEPLASPDIISFNHGLAEIFNALWAAGFEITGFDEHDTVPWPALGDAMHDVGGGEFRLIECPERLAASYTLQARLT
jgi:SAM-dependent methyltransferase